MFRAVHDRPHGSLVFAELCLFTRLEIESALSISTVIFNQLLVKPSPTSAPGSPVRPRRPHFHLRQSRHLIRARGAQTFVLESPGVPLRLVPHKDTHFCPTRKREALMTGLGRRQLWKLHRWVAAPLRIERLSSPLVSVSFNKGMQ